MRSSSVWRTKRRNLAGIISEFPGLNRDGNLNMVGTWFMLAPKKDKPPNSSAANIPEGTQEVEKRIDKKDQNFPSSLSPSPVVNYLTFSLVCILIAK